ncbi:MFS transporter [Kibdelosporangium phytohabitans]|uniref:MFS transporter n=1 Tax=Kibdelosporangium phytohabitans TaxID=860235 RepID=UPI0009FB1606|nr:MFS transporter [Kibdelosporangium phytohabitans]MBE1464092.1 putative MFS family arabinose efflux permease [Kibdelosporangium phytohabitans]
MADQGTDTQDTEDNGTPGPPGAAPPRRRIGGLWWQRDFRLLWVGETVSQFGSVATTVAIPLVAVTVLDASAFAVGLLSAAVWLPWLLFGLPAGAWVDRLPRKPLMLWCDAISFVLLVSVPVAAWFDVLTIEHLISVAFFAGVSALFFSTAYQVFLPAVVADKDLSEANAKVQGSESAAQIGGPGLGGLLAQAFGAVTSLLADAVTFLVSALCLARMKVHDPLPEKAEHEKTSIITDIREGLRYTVTDPYLRPLVIYSGTSNLADTALQAVLIVFLVREIGLDAATVGGLIAFTGVGGIVGAMVASRIAARLGTARTVLIAEIFSMPFALLIPMTTPGPGLVLFVIGVLVVNTGIAVSDVIVGTFRQSYTPRHLLGRITASDRWVSYGTMPIGAVLGGTLAGVLGAQNAIWIAAAMQAMGPLILLTGPMRKQRDLPT